MRGYRSKAVDAMGATVRSGSRVRVIKIPQHTLEALPNDEAKKTESMLNEIFEVYDIDEYGCAWVEKIWSHEDGTIESHSLSLSSTDMMVVKK